MGEIKWKRKCECISHFFTHEISKEKDDDGDRTMKKSGLFLKFYQILPHWSDLGGCKVSNSKSKSQQLCESMF